MKATATGSVRSLQPLHTPTPTPPHKGEGAEMLRPDDSEGRQREDEGFTQRRRLPPPCGEG